MNSRRVFILSFTLTFSVMLCAFAAIYWSLGISPKQAADATKTDVPILKAGLDDSKTLLVCAKEQDTQFFLLIKFNALQNKVSVASIPSSLPLDKVGQTLSQSFDYAGMLQCVSDLKQQFDIAVDYHILCDYDGLGGIISSFSDFRLEELGESLPESVKNILLAGSESLDPKTIVNILKMAASTLDSEIGLEFLNNSALILLKNNLENLRDYGATDIKDNFSYLTTNLNVQALDKLHRILSLLCENEVSFERLVLSDEETATEQLHTFLSE